MFLRLIVNLKGKHRREKLEGRSHLVVPCAMLQEGIIKGSEGAGYYPEDEIASDPSAWNGMPIVVYHPKDDDGDFTTARQPEVYNSRKIGTILNTEWDGKLRTECWIDEERCKEVDIRIHKAIIRNQQMETSTGLGADKDETPGKFGKKEYDFVVRNIKPDHLAILPDKIGAYSVAMGGGLFANAATEPESTQTVLQRSVAMVLNERLDVDLIANEFSFSDTQRQLTDLLSAKYGEKGKYWRGYICDVYPDYVIFSNDDSKLWMQSYKTSDSGIKLSGEATEVQRVIEYRAGDGTYVTNESGELSFTPSEPKMAEFNRKKHIASLIGNGFTEKDRKKLEALDDQILSAVKPKKKVANEDDEDEEVVDVEDLEDEEEEDEEEETPKKKSKSKKKTQTKTKKKVANEDDEDEDEDDTTLETPTKKKSVVDGLAGLSPEHREILNEALEERTNLRDRLIKMIVNSENNTFKEKALKKMDTRMLKGIAKMAVANSKKDEEEDDDPLLPMDGNYLGAAGSVVANEEDDDPVPLRPTRPQFADPRKK